ncbi:hypothetical protein CEXT_774981 [Caerostris extrusa]|uniref:Uncharacterized protein n=1 Tax=Caerostris extrusa TaxID=172846 RepID=A0AAV4SLZ9_CAEEX|nr:hypothetical protein CEXT_774981 [Caerostris extrusa]
MYAPHSSGTCKELVELVLHTPPVVYFTEVVDTLHIEITLVIHTTSYVSHSLSHHRREVKHSGIGCVEDGYLGPRWKVWAENISRVVRVMRQTDKKILL